MSMLKRIATKRDVQKLKQKLQPKSFEITLGACIIILSLTPLTVRNKIIKADTRPITIEPLNSRSKNII